MDEGLRDSGAGRENGSATADSLTVVPPKEATGANRDPTHGSGVGGDGQAPAMAGRARKRGVNFFDNGTLYRFFDSDGRLLYVGASGRFQKRVASHRAHAKWWDVAVMCRMERYPTLREALAAEAVVIATEHPIHNVAPGMYVIDRPASC